MVADCGKDKYIEASRIASEVLVRVIQQCQSGEFIRDICRFGDDQISEKISKIFKSHDIEKGIAYPTSINVNNYVSGYSPLADDNRQLVAGDIVKVRLGVQIDGHIAHVGHTVIVQSTDASSVAEAVKGPVADAVCAAYFASELVMRMIEVGRCSTDLVFMVDECARAFNVTPIIGNFLSSTTRFVPDNPQKLVAIPGQDDDQQQPFYMSENDVYIVTMQMCIGKAEDAQPKEASERFTICRRNVHKNCNLKLKSGRAAFEEITNASSVFPFAIRDLSAATRLGLKEGMQKELFDPVPVMCVRPKGNQVVEFTYTVMINADGSVQKLTDPQVKLPYVMSEYSLPSELQQLMASKQVKKLKMVTAASSAPVSDLGDQMEL